jgi:hypothetical protein
MATVCTGGLSAVSFRLSELGSTRTVSKITKFLPSGSVQMLAMVQTDAKIASHVDSWRQGY